MLCTAGTAGLIANVESTMNRRTFVSALIALPGIAAVAAACGDPDRQSIATEPTGPGTATAATTATTATTATAPAATTATTATSPATSAPTSITHPTGASDVVLRLGYEGGFVPQGYAFVNTPTLLISGDGRAFIPGAVPAVYPGPLLPTLNVRTINEAGLQSLLAIADQAHLLSEPPKYASNDSVADAANTVLTINANGTSYVHSAYALGIDGKETDVRKTLFDAVTAIADLDKAAGGGNVGPEQPFVPEVYRFQARLADAAEAIAQQPAGSVVDWPSTTGVRLADATTCARVDAAKVGTLFVDAKQNTYFKEGDAVYQLSAAGVLPGDPAC
jgi:hypothetical protein